MTGARKLTQQEGNYYWPRIRKQTDGSAGFHFSLHDISLTKCVWHTLWKIKHHELDNNGLVTYNVYVIHGPPIIIDQGLENKQAVSTLTSVWQMPRLMYVPNSLNYCLRFKKQTSSSSLFSILTFLIGTSFLLNTGGSIFWWKTININQG